jgi:NADH:ubiquinone reductase (H+-translocating)
MTEMVEDRTASNNSATARNSQRILILGGGFGGIEVLRRLQRISCRKRASIDVTLVSQENFFLFTPMLHEVSSGMLEPRHVATAVRAFCKEPSRFYRANVDFIDLKSQEVTVSQIASSSEISDMNGNRKNDAEKKSYSGQYPKAIQIHQTKLKYDYLVIALGSQTRFADIEGASKFTFTMRTLADAIVLRDHVIDMLEQAELVNSNNHNYNELRKRLLTFVVVGGGFGGVESVGALNDFLTELTENRKYHTIQRSEIHVFLITSGDTLLPEMGKDLGEFALEKLGDRGIKVMLNTKVKGIDEISIHLENENNHDTGSISSHTIVWSTGPEPDEIVRNLPCKHDDNNGRIKTNGYLEVEGYDNVYALGDCASIPNPHTGKTYPPTAQHAVREGKVVAKNIISSIIGDNKSKKIFDYKTRGIMATVGKRTAVAKIFGIKLHGFAAWWLWRTFYLSNLPTLKKKIRVMTDWTIDLLFGRDKSRVYPSKSLDTI